MTRPDLADVLRTLWAVATLLPELVLRLVWVRLSEASSTASVAGAAQLRALSHKCLVRLGVQLEVRGAERVPADGGLVCMWNQESHLDHLVLGAAMPRPFLSLYNNAVARFPLYGAHMRRTGHFHVDRTDPAQWPVQVAAAAAAVGAGVCVLVSPEGTRSPDGALLPFKRGAFLLARDAGRPIVCVTVVGGFERLRRGAWFVRGGPMRVVFSEPFFGDEAAVAGVFAAAKAAVVAEVRTTENV